MWKRTPPRGARHAQGPVCGMQRRPWHNNWTVTLCLWPTCRTAWSSKRPVGIHCGDALFCWLGYSTRDEVNKSRPWKNRIARSILCSLGRCNAVLEKRFVTTYGAVATSLDGGRGRAPRCSGMDRAAYLGGLPGTRPHARGEPGIWAHAWQKDAAFALHVSLRERAVLPAVQPDVSVLRPSQAVRMQVPSLHAHRWPWARDVLHLLELLAFAGTLNCRAVVDA